MHITESNFVKLYKSKNMLYYVLKKVNFDGNKKIEGLEPTLDFAFNSELAFFKF